MNMKKVLSGAVASVMAVSTMAVAASAYDASIFFADADWYPSGRDEVNMVDISKNGEYTIKATYVGEDAETGAEAPIAFDTALVFCVDIMGLGTDLGLENVANIENSPFEDVKVLIDGKEIAVDSSKLRWGDIEGNGNLRLEIYNDYGETKTDSPINVADVVGNEIAVSFKFTGFAEDASESAESTEPAAENNEAAESTTAAAEVTENNNTEAAATTAAEAQTGNTNTGAAADKNNADTGVEGVAAVAGIAIVAAGAVIIAKKRK